MDEKFTETGERASVLKNLRKASVLLALLTRVNCLNMANYFFGLLLVTLCVSASFVTSSGGIKYYTVSSEFYDVLSEARAGGVDVRPKITSKSDGTYKISVTTSKGTRELNEVSKSQVDLFAKLFTDSSSTITVVSQSGSNVKISVSEASGKSSTWSSSSSFGGGTKSYTVSDDFYDFLNEARGGGTGVTPRITSNSDGTYTISITTSKGTRELKNISKSSVDLFAQLFTNSNLKITLVSRSGSNVEISVTEETGGSSTYSSSFSSRGGSKSYTVTDEFYDFLNEARAGGTGVTPKITTKAHVELKNINKSSVDLFTQLFTNPNLKITLVSRSGSDVEVSVTEETDDSSTTYTTTTTTTVATGTISRDGSQEVKQYTVTVDFYDFITEARAVSDNGKERTISGIPTKAAKLIIYKAQNPSAQIHTSKSGKSSFPITTTTTTKTTYSVGTNFLKVYNFLKKNPTSRVKVSQETDGTYTLYITFDRKTKSYKNVKPSLTQLLIFLYKNPSLDFKVSPQSDGKYKIVLPKNADNTPTTSSIPKAFIPKLKEILDNPKYTIKVEEPKTGEYQLVVNDGSKDKTYKVPKSLVPVIEKLLKLPKGKDGKPNYHILGKDSKHPHISVDPTPEKITHPVDKNFVTFVKKIEKNPDLTKHITYNIQPTDDDLFDITVTLDSKKHVFKNLPHNLVQFFITFVNKPKDTPHTITEHDVPEHEGKKTHLTKDVPHGGKHHLTKDIPHGGKHHLTKEVPHGGKHHLTKEVLNGGKHHIPHKRKHTLTVDKPDGDKEIPFKVKPSTKQEPSTTKFPTTHEGKPKHHKPSEIPNTYTIVLKDGPKTKTYPDISIELVPILSQLYLTPTIDFEIKPTKDGRIEFVPFHPKPDEHHYEVPNRVFEIISSIRTDPSTTLKIRHTKHHDYTITLTNRDHTKTYENIKPRDVSLIVDFVANDDLPFSVKPTEFGVVLVVPKTDDTNRKVVIDTTTKKIVKEIRKHRYPDVTIEPDTDGQFTITIDDDKTYAHISPSLLDLIITLVTKPDLQFNSNQRPMDDGYKLVIPRRPSEPKFTNVPKDVIEFVIKEVKNPKLSIEITPEHDKPGQFDIDFFINGKKIKHFHNVDRDTIEFINILFSHPDTKIETETDDEGVEVIVLKKLDSPTTDYTISQTILKLFKDASNPDIISATAKHGKPGTFELTLGYTSGTKKTFSNIDKQFLEPIFLVLTKTNIHVRIYFDAHGKIRVAVPKGAVTPNNFKIQPDFYNFLKKVKPEISTLSFTLTPDEDNFVLIIKTKSQHKTFKHLPSSTIEFFIQFLLHPQRKIDIKTDPKEDDYELHVIKRVLRKGAEDVVFKNVKSKFIRLIQDLHKKTGNSLTIRRKSDLTLLIGYGKKGLEFSHFEPAVVIEFLISIFADPNFRYSAKIGADGTYTLIAHNLRRHVEFHSLSAAIKTKGQQLTASSDALALITKDKNKKLVLAISLNGGASEQFKDTYIETVRYIALSTIYKNLHFQEKKSASGSITIYVKLPAIKYDYDLTIYKVYTKKVSDISKSFGGIFGSIFGWLSSLVSGVISGAASIVSGVGHVATNVVGSVLSGAGSILGSVGSGIGSV
uniref:Uncharacterized protein n=1 Tax=Strigamia maritima TaxID=126957 RepID=T1IGR3_STRMM